MDKEKLKAAMMRIRKEIADKDKISKLDASISSCKNTLSKLSDFQIALTNLDCEILSVRFSKERVRILSSIPGEIGRIRKLLGDIESERETEANKIQDISVGLTVYVSAMKKVIEISNDVIDKRGDRLKRDFRELRRQRGNMDGVISGLRGRVQDELIESMNETKAFADDLYCQIEERMRV